MSYLHCWDNHVASYAYTWTSTRSPWPRWHLWVTWVRDRHHPNEWTTDRAGAQLYRQFHFFAFILDMERPPAFDTLVFEERHLWHTAVSFEHVQCTQLRWLCSSWKPVHIQCQCTYTYNNDTWSSVQTEVSLNDRLTSATPNIIIRSHTTANERSKGMLRSCYYFHVLSFLKEGLFSLLPREAL